MRSITAPEDSAPLDSWPQTRFTRSPYLSAFVWLSLGPFIPTPSPHQSSTTPPHPPSLSSAEGHGMLDFCKTATFITFRTISSILHTVVTKEFTANIWNVNEVTQRFPLSTFVLCRSVLERPYPAASCAALLQGEEMCGQGWTPPEAQQFPNSNFLKHNLADIRILILKIFITFRIESILRVFRKRSRNTDETK